MHTPYDGSARLFTIGARPIDPGDWIELNQKLPAYLDEKVRLFETRPGEVFAAAAGTEAAQAEALALLAAHLTAHFPETYRREGSEIGIVPAGRRVRLDDPALPPLRIAASLIADDLVLMRRDESGWRLVAGAVCFPSSWQLLEKAGRLIEEVHAPVPGFGGGTRGAELIARMFDSMRPGNVALRWNWSLYGDDALFHPDESPPRRFGPGQRAEPVFLRVERQTLRKLPESGDILFTIGIHVDPLEALEAQPEAPPVAAALIEQLEGLNDQQLAYKGLTLERGRLVARLQEIAER